MRKDSVFTRETNLVWKKIDLWGGFMVPVLCGCYSSTTRYISDFDTKTFFIPCILLGIRELSHSLETRMYRVQEEHSLEKQGTWHTKHSTKWQDIGTQGSGGTRPVRDIQIWKLLVIVGNYSWYGETFQDHKNDKDLYLKCRVVPLEESFIVLSRALSALLKRGICLTFFSTVKRRYFLTVCNIYVIIDVELKE